MNADKRICFGIGKFYLRLLLPVRVKVIAKRFFCLVILSFFIGCSKKQDVSKQREESSPVELTLPQIPKLPEAYKPTNKSIQIALKNAGFYKGKIDGDIGPITEGAIREFQANNDLVVDGEVGPKTWAVLKKYLK